MKNLKNAAPGMSSLGHFHRMMHDMIDTRMSGIFTIVKFSDDTPVKDIGPWFVPCDGRSIKRYRDDGETLSYFYKAFGTIFGAGDGSTTVQVPTVPSDIAGYSYYIKTAPVGCNSVGDRVYGFYTNEELLDMGVPVYSREEIDRLFEDYQPPTDPDAPEDHPPFTHTEYPSITDTRVVMEALVTGTIIEVTSDSQEKAVEDGKYFVREGKIYKKKVTIETTIPGGSKGTVSINPDNGTDDTIEESWKEATTIGADKTGVSVMALPTTSGAVPMAMSTEDVSALWGKSTAFKSSGVNSIKSPTIDDSEVAGIQFKFDYSAGAIISGKLLGDCEGGYDYGSISVLDANGTSHLLIDKVGDDQAPTWVNFSKALDGNGTGYLVATYTKDGSNGAGTDAIYLDDLMFEDITIGEPEETEVHTKTIVSIESIVTDIDAILKGKSLDNYIDWESVPEVTSPDEAESMLRAGGLYILGDTMYNLRDIEGKYHGEETTDVEFPTDGSVTDIEAHAGASGVCSVSHSDWNMALQYNDVDNDGSNVFEFTPSDVEGALASRYFGTYYHSGEDSHISGFSYRIIPKANANIRVIERVNGEWHDMQYISEDTGFKTVSMNRGYIGSSGGIHLLVYGDVEKIQIKKFDIVRALNDIPFDDDYRHTAVDFGDLIHKLADMLDSGYKSLAIGVGAEVFDDDSLAVGYGKAFGYSSFAMGNETAAYGDFAFAMGKEVMAQGNGSFAFGDCAWATDDYAIAMGEDVYAWDENSVAIGYDIVSGGRGSIGIGRRHVVSGGESTALGVGHEITGFQSVALGAYNDTYADYSIALGTYVYSYGDTASYTGFYSETNLSASTGSGFGQIATGHVTSAYGNLNAIGCETKEIVSSNIILEDNGKSTQFPEVPTDKSHLILELSDVTGISLYDQIVLFAAEPNDNAFKGKNVYASFIKPFTFYVWGIDADEKKVALMPFYNNEDIELELNTGGDISKKAYLMGNPMLADFEAEYGNVSIYNDVFGSMNIVNGSGNYIAGQRNEVDGNDITVVGKGNKSSKDGQTVMGTYNEESDDATLIIGMGTSTSARKNALTVRKEGTVSDAIGVLIRAGADYLGVLSEIDALIPKDKLVVGGSGEYYLSLVETGWTHKATPELGVGEADEGKFVLMDWVSLYKYVNEALANIPESTLPFTHINFPSLSNIAVVMKAIVDSGLVEVTTDAQETALPVGAYYIRAGQIRRRDQDAPFVVNIKSIFASMITIETVDPIFTKMGMEVQGKLSDVPDGGVLDTNKFYITDDGVYVLPTEEGQTWDGSGDKDVNTMVDVDWITLYDLIMTRAGSGGVSKVVTQDHTFTQNVLLPMSFDVETEAYVLADMAKEDYVHHIGVATSEGAITMYGAGVIDMPEDDAENYSVGETLYLDKANPGKLTTTRYTTGVVQSVGRVEKIDGELVVNIRISEAMDLGIGEDALVKTGDYDASTNKLPQSSLDNQYWNITAAGLMTIGEKKIQVGVGDLLVCDLNGWYVIPSYDVTTFLGYDPAKESRPTNLEEAMNQLFTSASNGKKGTVDILTGKGVEGIDHNSKWSDIHTAMDEQLGTGDDDVYTGIANALIAEGMDWLTPTATEEEIISAIEMMNGFGIGIDGDDVINHNVIKTSHKEVTSSAVGGEVFGEFDYHTSVTPVDVDWSVEKTLHKDVTSSSTGSTSIMLLMDIETISITNKITSLDIASTHQLEWIGTAYNIDNPDILASDLVFTTANNNVATINGNGLIVPVGAGDVLVRVATMNSLDIFDEFTLSITN